MSEGLTRLKMILQAIPIDEVEKSIKDGIMQKLQGVKTPEEAFKVKLELDVADEFFLWIRQNTQQIDEDQLN